MKLFNQLSFRIFSASVSTALFCCIAPPLLAEEGGSGHYTPGSMASAMDGVGSPGTFLLRYNMLNYSGDISTNQSIPVAGITGQGAKADSWAHGLTTFWAPTWGKINDNWNYAMSATLPYVFTDVTATVNLAGGGSIRRTDSVNGLGDIVLMPIIFNQKINPCWSINYRVGIYAPTGDYKVGRLANTGKNFWSFEPTVGFLYMDPNKGRQLSIFTGATFNTENNDTDYQSGTQIHIDATAAQHFPLWGGFGGVGVNAYWYEQVTGDSGAGATFGDFKGRTAGLGPVVSYSKKVGSLDLVGELKWLHEMETKNRLEGDYVWLKIICKF